MHGSGESAFAGTQNRIQSFTNCAGARAYFWSLLAAAARTSSIRRFMLSVAKWMFRVIVWCIHSGTLVHPRYRLNMALTVVSGTPGQVSKNACIS